MKASKRVTMTAPTTVPAPVTEKETPFTITVGPGESILTFNEGDVLSNAKVRREFFEAHIAKLYDESVVKRLAEIKTDAIDARLKACDVSEDAIGDDSENNVRMVDLAEKAPFMLADSSNVPSQRVLKSTGAYAGLAASWGRMIDKTTEGDLVIGIKGQIDADACPIVTCHNLVRQFGKMEKDGESVLSLFPPMGSKYRGPGAKGNKAPDGYRLPSDKDDSPTALPIWNGPWDKYKVQPLNAPDYDGDFIQEFTASTPDGEYWSSYVERVKDAIGNVTSDTGYARLTAEDLSAIDALQKDGSEDSKSELEGLLAEAAFQYNKRKNWYSKAISLYQATNKIADRFSVNVVLTGVQLKSETPEVAARKRKPYLLVTEIPSEKDPKKMKDVISRPQTLSFILGLAKKAHNLPGNTTIPKLTEKKRGTKKAVTTADGSKTPMIQTIDQFQNALSMLHVYVKTADKSKMILERTNDQSNGPEFCSALCSIYDTIQEVVMAEGVRERAIAHDQAVAKALGEKAKANIEPDKSAIKKVA